MAERPVCCVREGLRLRLQSVLGVYRGEGGWGLPFVRAMGVTRVGHWRVGGPSSGSCVGSGL